jgi:hypothetical protein
MSRGLLRSIHYAFYLSLALTLPTSFANATLGFHGCGDLEITTVSHEDTVVLPLHVHADTTCNQVVTMQLYIDGASAHGQSGQTLDYDWTSATATSHRVVVQGVDSSGAVLIKSQALTVNVKSAPAGMTGIVNIWNPTGCPAANSCPYAENLPGTFYVDARAYSNLPNIHNLEVWLDGVKKDENVFSNPGSTGTFHSTVALTAGVGNHRLVVQATDSSSTVVAKTATYFNVTSSNLGTLTNQEGMSLTNWTTCDPLSFDPCYSHYPPTTFTQGTRTGVQFNADGSWCCDQNNQPVQGAGETAQRHYVWPSTSVTAPPTFNPNPPTTYNFPFKYVKYEFDVYVPGGALTPQLLINNLEWETQQRLPDTPGTTSYVRNLAFEDNYDPSGTHQWRSYDFYVKQTNNTDNVTTRWQSMGNTYTQFIADTWYHVVLEAHLDESLAPGEILVRHDAIWAYPIVGGSAVRQGTNYHNSHIVPSTTSNDETTNAVQLGNSTQTGNNVSGASPWHILMDNIQITYTW